MAQPDYYAVMGLSKSATDKEIKTAYRRLARQYHPDLNKNPDAEESFKKVQEAYTVLKDSAKRKAYDEGVLLHEQGFSNSEQRTRQGYAQSPGGYQFYSNVDDAPFDESFFESLFRKQQSSERHGTVHISLEEAYHGGEKTVQWMDGDTPRAIKVKIPAGILSNQSIRVATHDLYLTIQIDKHPIFDLKGQDVYLTLSVFPWDVALGATVKVPTLGGQVELKIPVHSQGGKTLRLKHRGLPGKVQGDQYVMLKVVVPVPKTPEQEAFYHEMKKVFNHG